MSGSLFTCAQWFDHVQSTVCHHGACCLQALALGADAVLLGRPVMFGLALDGQKGVERILELLRREVELAMVLAGCSSLQDISKDLLMQYPASML